jgi:hypothetical protein
MKEGLFSPAVVDAKCQEPALLETHGEPRSWIRRWRMVVAGEW